MQTRELPSPSRERGIKRIYHRGGEGIVCGETFKPTEKVRQNTRRRMKEKRKSKGVGKAQGRKYIIGGKVVC